MDTSTAAWMTRAYGRGLTENEGFEKELRDLGVRVLTIEDEEYPERLKGDGAPLVLQVAGRTTLLHDEGVTVFARYRGEEGARLMDTLDGGGRAILVLSKGMLKAGSLLKGLAEPIADGSITLISAEPPRASWGPVRDKRRDVIRDALTR